MSKRIAAISDIHGNLPALRAVLQDIERCGADVTVNLGDILSGPLWPAETAELLMTLNLPTIAGNHERQVLMQARERMGPADAFTAQRLEERHRVWLAGLPPTCWLDDEVFCCHGTPTSDLQYFLDTVTDDFGRGGSPGVRPATGVEAAERLGAMAPALALCGHTHVPHAMSVGATLVVNPGSVGLQAYEDDHPHLHVMEIGSPHARWALLERTDAGWTIEQHAVSYDWESAARQAERHGSLNWAMALRTGRTRRARNPL